MPPELQRRVIEEVDRAKKRSSMSVNESLKHLGIARGTFYRWKKKFDGMGVEELRRLKTLEEENKRLKSLVADLSLDKQILQDVLSKKL